MAGHNPGSPTDFMYFYEDEVYKINSSGRCVFGLVLENYEGNSSDVEGDIDPPVQRGEIRVVWHPSGVERVVSEKTVGLSDRSLMPGDVVRRLIAGKDTQRGYCRDIIMTAALQVVGTKHVLPCVASQRLEPLEDFTADLAVCLDSWVGTSKAVNSKLRLMSSDGSRLEYPDLDNCPLEDYTMRRRRATPYSSAEYYPGQVVYGVLGSLDHANWIHTTKEMKAARKNILHEHKFTVEAVVTESVSVHWQCRALSNGGESGTPQQPKFLVEGEDLKRLKLLNVFEPCTLQVGDRNFITITEHDTFTTKKQWQKQQSKHFRHLRKQNRPSKKDSKDSKDSHEKHSAPSKPKKRASYTSRDSSKSRMKVEKMEVDEVGEGVPSIRVEPSEAGEGGGASGSLGHTPAEEKNDSGISPDPAREELTNGDARDDDDSDNWENTCSDDGSDTDSGATWSSRCSSAASTRGKRSPQLAVRLLRGKRLKRAARRAPPAPPPACGARVVVETLHTSSRADVVWQDGTIETGIPSTQLYPIHHLDGQECFPGDFVVSGATVPDETSQTSHRDYGVVQKVDHHGRTAIVKWYRTYTSTDEPVPQLISESEVSVYDLKDHPDFQYRPGTVVIRVANFTGEDAACTAGQVMDNFPSGRVKVWWVDGHTSMCWPQDLYKVGEYDSEEGELWGSEGSASDDSWETQSTDHNFDVPLSPDAHPHAPNPPEQTRAALTASEVEAGAGGVPRLLEPRVAAHMERGRVAMQRLEEMFAREPQLQSQEIMRKLLNVYKDCRFLDRLMGTTFFHEDHFLGLLERVRERGASTPSAGERRVHDQLTRLFTPTEGPEKIDFSKVFVPPEVLSHSTNSKDSVTAKDNVDSVPLLEPHDEPMQVDGADSLKAEVTDNQMISSTTASEFTVTRSINSQSSTNQTPSEGATSRNVCYKLCSLINAQLMKAHAEISRRQPAELANFLNELMSKKRDTQEKLPYHFAVQYGYLVVSVTCEKDPADGEGADGHSDHTVPLSDDSTLLRDTSSTSSKVSGRTTAPLATAESGEVEAAAPEDCAGEGFSLLESAPPTHHFRLSMLQPSEPRAFYSAVKREIKLLKSDLPPGVWVRGFEDRIDLMSVMIAGPKKTPYEDGLFLFDVQLGGEYPRAPPLCHYISYCSDRLNPNLYEDGKVCVSLLGTWSGRGVEVWGKDSSLLQVIVSLQGLILNAEPYFNEAGYEKQKGSQQGLENSRMYNEMVLLKLVQSMTKLIGSPPDVLRAEILRHYRAHALPLCDRLEAWVRASKGESGGDVPPPDFPLIPASRGFCLTLSSSLEAFRAALRRNNIPPEPAAPAAPAL